MRMWLAILPFVLSATAFAQQPTEDEIGKAIIAAQQAVAKEFKVPEKHVQLVGAPQVLPDHVSLHRKPAINPALAVGALSSKTAIVLTLDAVLDDMGCGNPKVLVQGDQVEVLTGPLRLPDSERTPFTAEECRHALYEIDRFMEIAFDYERGPERFDEVLAAKLESNSTHNPPEYDTSDEDHRKLVAVLLEAYSYMSMVDLEGLDLPRLDETPEMPGRTENVKTTDMTEGEREVALMKEPLHEMGAFEKEHLAAVVPRLKYARTLIYKHPPEVGKQDGFGPVVTYHLQWGGPDLIFVSESGHLKLLFVGGD